MNGEAIHSNADVAAILGIGDSTLRKYARALEEHGYKFMKDASGARFYRDKDVLAIRKYIELMKRPDMNKENAANAVVSMFQPVSGTEVVPVGEEKNFKEELRSDPVLREILEFMKKQQEIIEEYRNELQTIRQMQETQRQLAAAREEEKKKPFWKKLFGWFSER